MQQLSRILPAQARIRNRFSVHVILTSDLLAALNQITLDHHALHQLLNIPGNISAVICGSVLIMRAFMNWG